MAVAQQQMNDYATANVDLDTTLTATGGETDRYKVVQTFVHSGHYHCQHDCRKPTQKTITIQVTPRALTPRDQTAVQRVFVALH